MKTMRRNREPSDFLQYLAASRENAGSDPADMDEQRLPTLQTLSELLGVGVSRLREQMEVARALGLVEVKPRTGIRRRPYSFLPAVRQSLNYALLIDRSLFESYSDLRNHVEAAYWFKAVERLDRKDKDRLQALLETAWSKLRGTPIRIPHKEHRKLHLTIFNKLENPFVSGILEAYWEAYEAVGLNLYADYSYLEQVWNYHRQMVDSICNGDFDAGYLALVEHKDMLYHRPMLPSAESEIPVEVVSSS
jgi:DNA-binding FadR family transcriptional regulator